MLATTISSQFKDSGIVEMMLIMVSISVGKCVISIFANNVYHVTASNYLCL